MTTIPDDFINGVLLAGLRLMPPYFDSYRARCLLTAISGQEADWIHTTQTEPGGKPGPARSVFQFEIEGVAGILADSATRRHALDACLALHVPASAGAVYEAIAENGPLACVFARLNLWACPRPLPLIGDQARAWNYYLDVWRPGRPRPWDWTGNYAPAVSLVMAQAATDEVDISADCAAGLETMQA